MQRIVVIGGGITGCATAAQLAAEGVAVTLVEKHRIAAMASGWTLGGVRQSGRHPAELPLATAAVERWGTLDEELGADVLYRRDGNLRLARDGAEVDAIRALVDAQRALGLDLAFLPDNAAVRAVAPELSDAVLAASFCPSDGHADPVKATAAFAAHARRLGADIREGVAARAVRVGHARVTGVETSQGFIGADGVVLAAGIHAPSLLAPLGLALPLSIKVVHVVLSAAVAPCFAPVFGVANADCAGRQQVDGRFRYTLGRGEWPHADAWTEASLRPADDVVRMLVERVGRFLPVVAATPIEQTWGGLIDQTPDGLPVIDAPDAIEGLVVAAGFSGHGFCLGPVSGELCADLALGRPPRHPIDGFELARFRADAARTKAVELTLHG
jgi:sarcosine oxidase subunit beta